MKKKRTNEHKIGMYLGGKIDWDPDFVRPKLPKPNYGKMKRQNQVGSSEKSRLSSGESP